MPGPEPTKVYYIPGRLLVGYPLEDHEVESKAAAEELVATGLYTLTAKEAADQAWTTPEATPASDENVKKPRLVEEPAGEEEPAPAPTPRVRRRKAKTTPSPDEPEASADPLPAVSESADDAGEAATPEAE